MKYFFSIILLFIPFCIFSQTDSISSVHVDSISPKNMEDSESLLELLSDIRYNQDREYESNRYKIYPTENIYILIKLDTQTGKLELIQWSLKSKEVVFH